MNPIQQAIANRNKKIVIGVGILFAGLWVMLVMYVLAESQKYTPEVHPGVVEVHSASPTGGGAPAATYAPHRVSAPLVHSTYSSHQWSYIAPKATMQSTSSSMRLYQTSSASVHSVGGGTAGGGIATTNGQSNSDKGIRYAALAYSGAIYIPMINNAVTAVGATHADDVSSHKMSVIKRHNDYVIPGYNPDPTPDPEEPESPIGDVAWGLMALLVAAYGYHLFRRNRPQSNEINK